MWPKSAIYVHIYYLVKFLYVELQMYTYIFDILPSIT